MAILPTAHATQRFGSRAIDFYVAPGQVIGSDPRARADERRIQDLDGERHPVRIGKRDFALDAGDYAAVIRMQPGPKRRSSPVAVVNYRTGSWTRTSQDNTRVLSRAGVSRNANWLLTLLALTLLALIIVWPQMLTLLGLFAPGLAAGLPSFDVFSALVAIQPGLADARLAGSVPAVSDIIAELAPQLSGFEGAVIFAGITLAGALLALGARSWRFAWVPVFLIITLAGAVAIGGPETAAIPALLALAGSAALFIVAGIINRWRDAARLEARIARLADHVLRHPPQEMVTRREMPAGFTETAGDTGIDAADEGQDDRADMPAAPVAAAAAAAASISSADGTQEAALAATPAETAPDADDHAEAGPAITAGPDDGAQPVSLEAGEAAGAETQAGHDPRAEARSMDIPPPPPMPSEAVSGDTGAERVNRDAETTEAGAGALTGPVVTDTETLQPDAPVETAGIVSPDSGNAAASLESDASEDASLAAGDAFGGQEDPAAAAVDGDPEDAVTGGEDAGKPREG
ncbi:hypothetical protein GCM10007420_00090 [Glycocaulis albus]|uniref:Uncharacterized protein n=1 Tax=Glycocaulis albus TaxID=1382801 RepID=A0ABQ1XBF6_9PROT|nr:hypothetical protein [Glycocaulis albus]GGG89089.1 hypothetical protein GCM10007420_00090 [Glycocaulis albus]